MSKTKTKAELREEVEMLSAELVGIKKLLRETQDEQKRAAERIKQGVKKQSDQLQEARDKIYNEAQVAYTSAVATAKEVYDEFRQQVPENLGMVSLGVREQVMFTLKQVFGDDL